MLEKSLSEPLTRIVFYEKFAVAVPVSVRKRDSNRTMVACLASAGSVVFLFILASRDCKRFNA